MRSVLTTESLDIEALLAPLPGDDPAGDPRAYAHRLRDQLHELRREDDPDDYDEATRPAQWKHADWNGVAETASAALVSDSKDIRVACHLAEALVRLNGLAGLHQSLTLLLQLTDECWDRLNPPLDPEDPDTRAAPLANMLDDPVRGLCFPNVIRQIPLLGRGAETCSLSAWKQMRTAGGESADLAEALLHSSDPEELTERVAAADASLNQLEALRAALNEKLGDHAPGLCHLEEAVTDCRGLLAHALAEVGVEPTISPAETSGEQDNNETTAPPAASGQLSASDALRNRREAYRRIEQAARFLNQLEPHSPVPLLVLRAVKLSDLPFPSLIRQFVREENILSEMDRELGIGGTDPTGAEPV